MICKVKAVVLSCSFFLGFTLSGEEAADTLLRSGKSDQAAAIYQKILADNERPAVEKSAARLGLVHALHDKKDFASCAEAESKFRDEDFAGSYFAALARFLAVHAVKLNESAITRFRYLTAILRGANVTHMRGLLGKRIN